MNMPSAPAKKPPAIGKILYGFLFVAALPCLLVAWARTTEGIVVLPIPDPFPAGWIISLLGAAIMVAGLLAIVIYGDGLPMNAYPPARLVTRGIFRFVAHPIYTGFSFLCLGLSIAAGSASGLWLVSPAVALGCLTLVQGYEKQDLLERFGPARPKPLLHLPADDAAAPKPADRLSVYILVLLPWLLAQRTLLLLATTAGTAAAAAPLASSLEASRWAEPALAAGGLFILLVPLVPRTSRDLRNLAILGLLATGMVILGLIAYPAPALSQSVALLPRSRLFPGWLETLLPGSPAMLASFVAWVLLAARAHASRGSWWRLAWPLAATIIALSTTPADSGEIVGVLAGLGVAAIAAKAAGIWEATRHLTERIANMWREWRLGPVRIINHGFFAGAGGFLGLSIVGTLVGPGHAAAIPTIGASILITSALWAQLIEGSPSLLRPYGWYGGVLGALLGILGLGFFGADPWLLAAAFCVGGPWAQSAGRLRCLVQGCCHGRASAATIGIRYTHPRSRVVRLSALAGVPVHPTPLYSILWNLVVSVVAARIWLLHAPASMILGVYLILSGMGRFVEESYRGEPQTPVYAGLRFYQWMAVSSVLLGVFISMVTGAPAAPSPAFNWESVLASGGFGLIACILLGVDFPESNRRFARLA